MDIDDVKLGESSHGSDGSFFLNDNKPFVVRYYNVSLDNPTIATGFIAVDFTTIIAGFNGQSDIAANGGVLALPQVHDGVWVITCDLVGVVDGSWDVFVLLIRNEMMDSSNTHFVF